MEPDLLAPGAARARGDATSTWLPALLLLGALAVLLLWFPVLRATVGFEIDYSEGWNVYWQQKAAAGVPLYGAPPVYTIANYPPLSFHLIGLLGRLFGNTLLTGRVVAMASLLLISAVAAAIVINVTASRCAGWYAALCLPVWLYVFAPERIGMDDPQLLGMFLELMGFCIWVRGPGRPWHVLASALIFALAVFTKDTLIALPAAVATWLIVCRDWRRLALWIGAGAVASGILGAVTMRVDGRFLLDDLLRPRAWAYLPGLGDDVLYLLMFLLSFGFAAAWSIGLTGSPRRLLLALGWLYTHLLGFVLAFGNGVGLNIQFESLTLGCDHRRHRLARGHCQRDRSHPSHKVAAARPVYRLALPVDSHICAGRRVPWRSRLARAVARTSGTSCAASVS